MFPHVQSYSWTCTDIPSRPLWAMFQHSDTCLRSASRGDYILPRSRLRCADSVHSLYRHQLHGTICLHIFVVVPLCRSFYLNSSLTFSSPLSLLSNIIPYSLHTLFRFILFSFLFLLLFSMFVFISVWCHYVWRPRALVVRRLSKSTDLIWFPVNFI